MRELQTPPIHTHFAREDATHTGAQVFLAPRLVEERERHGAGRAPIRDSHLKNRALALTHRSCAHIEHLGHDRDVLVKRHIRNCRELAATGVAPRIVRQQVTHRDNAECFLEARGRFAAHDTAEFGVEWIGHESSLFFASDFTRDA